MSTTPPHYINAKLRGVLPYHADTDRIGLSFDIETANTGQTLRIALDGASARHLIESVADYLASGSQSARSSDIPSVEGSVIPGQSV